MNNPFIHKAASASFDIEVSQAIGEAVRDIVGREGDIVFGQLIGSLARAANGETDRIRKDILLTAIDSLLDDRTLQPQDTLKTPVGYQ
ncbi:hypothetical protein [Enterobacillus tribolii]|uniref:Uncharacterized protein n=1 Tax=Enterobacillus tribolii TaxID=1487935 RepID=A0A370R4G1_9GAMM|nr:hypothetical protein [Enterobacillus tribolii]MBW7983263.1 hypothetical protein [Enterobacillus tribolii]RDK97318.1 hypothetical protein C8D90_101766 [Enterobacillus tribolii]